MIALVLFILTLSVLAIEDYKTLYVDLRVCFILFGVSIFYAYMNDISAFTYITNLISGFSLMVFLFVFSIKVRKCKINHIPLQVSNADSKTFSALGFIPSFLLGYLIFLVGAKHIGFIESLTENSKFFLSDLGLYILIAIWGYVIIKLARIFLKKKNPMQNIEVITGMGDGDVIVITIVSGIVDISDMLVILSVSSVIHLLSYLFVFFINGRKYNVRI